MTMQSLSLNACDSPLSTRPCGPGAMIYRGTFSFNERDADSSYCYQSSSDEKPFGHQNDSKNKKSNGPSCYCEINHSMPTHQRQDAALKLQKVYRSFRTRRQLADCAVVVEQRWWKLLDFAELKRRSISFFDIEKPETAISRWSRAGMRVAKVGKGLSKDAKARKLALQHWLEAVDPRHRYGHNLQFYYIKWLQCESKHPFFYWLDIGDGKEVNHERCPRIKLQQQCIKYLGPAERKAYEVIIVSGKLVNKESGILIHTTDGPKDAKWIFVLSTSKTLYIGQKIKGAFQHSSFLAGGATLSAGRLVAKNGVLKAVWPHSGHYLPTEENFQEFISFLKDNGVDTNSINKNPTEEEERLLLNMKDEEAENGNSVLNSNNSWEISKLANAMKLKIPKREEISGIIETDDSEKTTDNDSPGSANDEGYESGEDSLFTEEDFMFPKMGLFDDHDSEEEAEQVPREKILKRIDSHKVNTYQLAKQLSSTWTTGAGPRIGCMRDYPSELQCWALEHANLSPRCGHSSPRGASWCSPKWQHRTAMVPVSFLDNKPSKHRSRFSIDNGV